jgi:hypothetical protein
MDVAENDWKIGARLVPYPWMLLCDATSGAEPQSHHQARGAPNPKQLSFHHSNGQNKLHLGKLAYSLQIFRSSFALKAFDSYPRRLSLRQAFVFTAYRLLSPPYLVSVYTL